MAHPNQHADTSLDISHPSICLPTEIWNLVLSHADRNSLAKSLRVSRLLFDLAASFLWNHVDITVVLALLPSFRHEHLQNVENLETEAPSTLFDIYFERLNLYAPYIQSLRYSATSWDMAQNYSQNQWVWPAIATYTANQPLLPSLKALAIEGSGESSDQLCVALDWMNALILPGISLVQCSFELKLEGINPIVKSRARDTLGLVLAQSPKLAYLSLQSYDTWDVVEPSNNDHFPFQDIIPQSLTYLAITSELLTSSSLTWIAQIPNLETLQLSSPGLTAQHIIECSSAVFPLNSFGALRCLEVTTSSLGAAMYLWGTPIAPNLTEASIFGGRNWDTGKLLLLVATKSPKLNKLELGIRIDSEIDPCILTPLATLPLRELRIVMTRLASTSVLQTVGSLWPDLEILDLSLTVIDLRDFLHISNSLPKLKQLVINLPTAVSPEYRKLAEVYHPPTSHADWSFYSFTLVSSAAWTRWIAHSDLDVLARLLAMACPHVKIELGYDLRLAESLGRFLELQEKTSDHGEALLAMTKS